ncbi:CPBP family intramembrane metalloprotease [Brevibacillus sp. HB1.3]|uniref:CPBP family intramembrane glutamic endopeptidase n=1 Tax=Brevibacillus sp. HB1.3 TaxID=2738842 RepID=UPI001556DABF|nr:type II CAAX endopeptidase family protein [Brevibacillus sp. HB1.3]NQF15733.1 CPBP family intramembrane metalloprotease [Brevibacillus sp. HB1.3]
MKHVLLFLGPTLMIFLGLQVMSSVPVTFLLFYGWLFAVPFVDMIVLKGNTWRDTFRQMGLRINRPNMYHGIWTGLLFFLIMIVAGYFFHSALFDKDDLQILLVQWDFSGNLVVWLILVLLVINPFLEEIYWRGYLFKKLEGRRTKRTMILLTSLFYSLYHFLSIIPLFSWPYNIAMILPVFLAGMIWGYMRDKSNSLMGSIVSHILADSGIMAVYLLFLK